MSSETTRATDRRLAAERWLLSALPGLPDPSRHQARLDWRTTGIALLPLGTHLAAVRLPGVLVQAVAASVDPADVDCMLDEVLGGGPVVCDAYREVYYALVPAGVPVTWSAAAEHWRAAGVQVLGRGSYLGVPRVDAVESRPGRQSYWAVPVQAPGTLCPPLRLARLVAAAGSLC